ncbi:reverse transcriptase zinc-binding domain-containing protein [Artemisia annua]|uniref:Reverse transcriptase zinc-binding domain-containing protein n=1 Tax=Artemisia annua TaxID=35608 RepID=A0A2U1LZG6_ARTAN|nr:reverse transcriptase zinc-binding domain-containing protein [Artemisia annua]
MANSDGHFTVNSAKRLMFNRAAVTNGWVMNWKGWAPLKCKILAWRASLDRLPTKMELIKRGVPLQHAMCTFCNSEDETLLHLFTGCPFSDEIWSRIQH